MTAVDDEDVLVNAYTPASVRACVCGKCFCLRGCKVILTFLQLMIHIQLVRPEEVFVRAEERQVDGW